MIHRRLLEELERVAGRCRRLYVWTALAVAWTAAAVLGFGLLTAAWYAGWTSPWAAPLVAVVAMAGTMVSAVMAVRSSRDPRQVARRVEARHPELDDMLLAAVEQRPALARGRFGYLQESVIREALSHARWNRWHETVPPRRLRWVQIAGAAVLVLLVAEIGGLADAHREVQKAGLGFLSGGWGKRDYRVTVTPGDAEIERGTSLVVTARFDGPVPDDATLVHREAGAASAQRPMSLSLSDPMFGARIEAVGRDLTYRVEYAGRATRDYRVAVFDYPELVRADVRLVFPEYTGLAEKRVEDTRRVTAVEGTRITLECRLNKPIESAQLVGENERMALGPQPGDATRYSLTWTLQKSGRWRLHLVDDRQRQNKQAPEFVFQVLPNRPAEVKVLQPARDMRVSPLEELQTKAGVWDDFGLRAYGISYSLAGQMPAEIVLGGPDAGNQRKEIAHVVDFEALKAEPDQLLSYHFWAEDTGPDARPRRTSGDMYFAEVRHFEEIFRQGEQAPGGESQQQGEQQGGNERQAEELAEKQKEIINATWTVIRRETGAKPTAQFTEDVGQIAASQQELQFQVAELAEKLEDPESQQHVAEVEKRMGEAVAHLGRAAEAASPQGLAPALAAEQAAYQALLKLRAREHRVTRGNSRQRQQSSSSASNNRSRFQQQLDQLELKDAENRYETERQAQPQQDAADRENREVLNRLRDLARRQSDLNDRLKELQSALQEAKTDQQRKEIEKQLQRLRDQQQQMLRDTDELADRMQRPENQERMAQPRESLQNTRENLRQATDALQQGQVPQALTSGTRAQRELDQMRDQFRRQTAGRFSEEASQLRQDARKLDKNEQALAERLQKLDQAESQTKSLRDSSEREEVSQGFQQQKEDLGRLLDDMQKLVEEAEEAEPLLTEQLYDALREARQQKLDDALDTAEVLLDRGFTNQAGLAESEARQGIGRLKEGVEKAAQSVLGDETEALRRARETLEDLAEQVDEEIERGKGEETRRAQAEGKEPAQDASPLTPNSSPARGEGLERSGPDRPDAPRRAGGPITGEDFLTWSDRLRDVEEMVDDADLRADAARIRDNARGIRRDLRRENFKGPNWDLVRQMVAEPLAELRDRVAEELARRGPQETLVPIDRDPVPPKYADQVRRYYEQLGSGK